MARLQDSSPSPRHALVVPFPVQSHINPMVHFSKVLASHGVRVTCVLPEQTYHQIQESQQPPPNPSGNSDPGFQLMGLHNVFPPEGARNLFKEALGIEEAAVQLIEKLAREGASVTCIIADVLIPWAHTVSEKFALMDVAYCSTTATAYAAYCRLPQLIDDGFVPLKPADRARNRNVIHILPGAPKLYVSDLPRPAEIDETGSIFQVFCDLTARSSKSEYLLVNSIHEIENGTVEALRGEGINILTVGPSIPYGYLGMGSDTESAETTDLLRADDKCIQWLDTKATNSVLYISFGSVILMSSRQIRELALGLEATQQPFLWVLRRESMIGGVNIEEALPEGFLSRTKEQGMVVSWAPQLEVLSHASVGGFFLQFGWTSSLEGLSMGVPMMGPGVSWADNTLTLRLLESECKIVMECNTDEEGIVEKEEVERVVREVMQGEQGMEMRSAAKKYREVARSCVREGGSSYENLRAFVRALSKHQSTQHVM